MKALLYVLLVAFTGSLIFAIYWGAMAYRQSQSIRVLAVVTDVREVDCNDYTCYKYTLNFTDISGTNIDVVLDLNKDYAKIGETVGLMYEEGKPQLARLADILHNGYNIGGSIVLLILIISRLMWCLRNG